MPTPRKYANRAEQQRAYRQRQELARQTELQRKGIPAAPPIPTMPGTARWNALLESAKAMLETIREEMQTYHDERSEQWQESERGEEHTTRIDIITSALETLDEPTG